MFGKHIWLVGWLVLAVFLEYSNSLSVEELTLTLANIPPDGRLSFCELAKKCGFKCIRYNVTSPDGYILGVFNIPGDRCKPIYLQHGLVDSSDTFLLRENTSLVAFLAGKGYDIWLGNMRGNKYSREHLTRDPEQPEFWEFSFHEIAMYDVPAMIDFVLAETKQKKLQAIGHSQGTTLFLTLGSMKPEYNEKFKVVICLAPIVYLQNAEPLFPLTLPGVGPGLSTILSALGPGELMANCSELTAIVRVACSQQFLFMSYNLCIRGFAFPMFGEDSEQVEPEFLPMLIGHYPSGSSIQNGNHLLQLASRKKFAQYDYGWYKNLEKYRRIEPPVYNLSKVTMKVALVVGLADKVTNLKDIQLLKSQLPNADVHIIDRKEWNHLDFVWAKDMDVYLFGYIHDTLKKYCK